MPKMKTKRAAAKRFSFTATGKVKINRQNRRHILTSKSSKRKRSLRHGGIASPAETSAVKRMIPYK